MDAIRFHGDMTFFVGENGAGTKHLAMTPAFLNHYPKRIAQLPGEEKPRPGQ